MEKPPEVPKFEEAIKTAILAYEYEDGRGYMAVRSEDVIRVFERAKFIRRMQFIEKVFGALTPREKEVLMETLRDWVAENKDSSEVKNSPQGDDDERGSKL